MKPERKKLLNSIRPSDIVLVRHGRGSIRAKVEQSAPYLIVSKLPKSGRHMEPVMISIFDVIDKEQKDE